MHDYVYAVFSTLGYLAGSMVFLYLARRRGRKWGDILPLLAVVIVSAVFGAKLFHVLFEANGHAIGDDDFASGVADLLAFDPWHWVRIFSPGFVFYGGLVVAGLVGAIYLQVVKPTKPLELADCATPGLALGLAIGRVGCYFAGCCFGDAGPLPVQIVESGFAALLFLYLLSARGKRDGFKLAFFMITYSIFRFGIEFVRNDEERGFWLNELFSTSQLISLFLLGFCLVDAFRRRSRSL